MDDTPQHLDDVAIPEIEIAEGWKANSIATREDAEKAFDYLMAAVAQIEYQLDMEMAKRISQRDHEWLARARKHSCRYRLSSN
jgi:hypothetical protein